MPRPRQHRIVDHDDRQGADGMALAVELDHLGDLLFERATGEPDAERVPLRLAGLGAQAGGAGIFSALVTTETVMRLAQILPPAEAGIGEVEAVTMAARFRRAHEVL